MLGLRGAMTMQALPFPLHKRTERGVIAVAGTDAPGFLQGLLTADIEALAPGEAAYAALLQPQGKILFDIFALNAGARYLIDCSAAQMADLIKRLMFYKLRARVEIGDLADHEVGVSFVQPSQGNSFADPRSPLLGFRVIAPAGQLPSADDGRYRFGRIRLGIADSDEDIESGRLFPHEANLDQLGGVSFTKGCFVGQEVVSRMEHRGTARSRILPVNISGGAPAKGAEVKAGDAHIGTVLSADGEDALALIRLDRLKEAAQDGRLLLTDGRGVHVTKPPWAKYEVATMVEAG
jgi:folate-binding protein YgfZ